MFALLTYTIHADDSIKVKIIDRIEDCIKDYMKINPQGMEMLYIIGLNYRSDWDDISDCLETVCKDYSAVFDFYLSPVIPNGRRSSFLFNRLTIDELNLLMDIIE